MSRLAQIVLPAALAVMFFAPAARAQNPSELVGFNGPPIDDPATSQEMFKQPEWSGSTADYVVPNDPNAAYGNNAAFRAAGLQTEGDAAMYVFFDWVDATDSDAWLRLTTFDAPERPNPSLHVEGQVRFKITNRSELFDGEIGICLGIRETGIEVPQLEDGGSSGDIEWVGVSTTPNGIIAGTDGIVDTEATGDDVQEYPVGYDIINDPNESLPTGTAVISPGDNGTIDTTPAGDDELRFGYFISASGGRRPIPAITLPPSSDPYELEWDLSTGEVTLDGTPAGGGIAGFTGDGDLSVTPSRGTLEHIAFTNLPDDPAVSIELAIDELQFESPEADPVHAPTVVWPIIAGDETVTVTDLQYGVDRVTLLLDHAPLLVEDVTTTDDVVFTLSSAAETDQVYTATQRVGDVTSEESFEVTVLPEPPPYTFCLLVDESGTGSCDPYGTDHEWVGVTDADGWAPLGYSMFPDSAVWQTIDIPLNDDDVILASPFGGDGVLDDSESGYYTIDSLWFTLAEEEQLGPWVVFIDSVQVIDEFGDPGEVILDMEDGVNRLRYARGQSADECGLISSQLSTAAAYDGATSHRLEWEYDGTEPEAIGMLQREGYTCGTSALIPDTATAIRFHFVLRSDPNEPNLPLPEVVGPIVVGTQDTARITHEDSAQEVHLLIDGSLAGTATPSSGETETDFSGLTLEPGQSISATQTLTGGLSDPAYPRVVLDAPPPPAVSAPIAPGATTVEVTDLLTTPHAEATLATAYVNGEQHGLAIVSGDTVTISLDVELATGDAVTAKQYVNGAWSAESDTVTVAYTEPVIYMAPAEGDATVTVMVIEPDTDTVTVVVNDTTEFEGTPQTGSTSCDVPVSGLVAGDSLTAYYTVDGIDSVVSDYEIVTTNVTTYVLPCDDFETYAGQAAMEAVWTQEGDPNVLLSTDMNATCPDGTQSAYNPPGAAWMQQSITPTVPSATEPVVFNVNIYDPVGEDPNGLVVQWAELNYFTGGGDYSFYIHVGMLGWADTDNVHYDLRCLGYGGPNWVDLADYDGPVRSVGWHNFTVVHKGDRVDAYVDGLLAKKNIQLNSEPTYGRADIGGGYASTLGVYFDDLCVEVGPAHVGCVAEEPGCPNPGDSGNYCTADIDGSGDCVVGLADLAQLLGHYGTASGAEHDDGDLDDDGDVDLADLAALLGQYGDDCN